LPVVSSGEVDFVIDSSLYWGIELLILGSDVGSHVSRFAPGGIYAPLQLTDYLVVDFRRGPVSRLGRFDRRVSVFLSRDYSTCDVVQDNEIISNICLQTDDN
jgi:hypothetical protein